MATKKQRETSAILAAAKLALSAKPSGAPARASDRFGTTAWSRPLYSLASSCHPSQAAEFNAEVKRAGLTGVYYDEKGKAHFDSRGQRKAWNKHRGLIDRDGGYGD